MPTYQQIANELKSNIGRLSNPTAEDYVNELDSITANYPDKDRYEIVTASTLSTNFTRFAENELHNRNINSDSEEGKIIMKKYGVKNIVYTTLPDDNSQLSPFRLPA